MDFPLISHFGMCENFVPAPVYERALQRFCLLLRYPLIDCGGLEFLLLSSSSQSYYPLGLHVTILFIELPLVPNQKLAGFLPSCSSAVLGLLHGTDTRTSTLLKCHVLPTVLDAVPVWWSTGNAKSRGLPWPANIEVALFLWYKARQEVMEQLFKVNQPNISLSVPVTVVLSLYVCYHSTV